MSPPLLLQSLFLTFTLFLKEVSPLCHQNVHHPGVDIDITPGDERGIATFPLIEVDLRGNPAYVGIIDSSDQQFCEEAFDCIHSPKLSSATDDGVEEAEYDEATKTLFFSELPGTVNYLNSNGDVVRAVGNPAYSPIKKFQYKGRTVYVNAPLIWWGHGPGEALIVDKGGCDPLIRSNPPNPGFVGFGPSRGPGFDCADESAMDRYRGGQLLALDVTERTFSIKLHFSFFNYEYELPHYIVFEATKLPAAEMMGVLHAPRLAALAVTTAAAPLYQFANGIPDRAGGPSRFQPGIPAYQGGTCNYVPIWIISWFFFDCDGDGVFKGLHNRGECEVCGEGVSVPEGCCPVEGQRAGERYDPLIPETYDPFQADDKGVSCRAFAEQAINDGGRSIVASITEANQLVQDGLAYLTRAPPGLFLNSTLQPDLIVNCPVPMTLKGNDCLKGQTWHLTGERDLDFPTCSGDFGEVYVDAQFEHNDPCGIEGDAAHFYSREDAERACCACPECTGISKRTDRDDVYMLGRGDYVHGRSEWSAVLRLSAFSEGTLSEVDSDDDGGSCEGCCIDGDRLFCLRRNENCGQFEKAPGYTCSGKRRCVPCESEDSSSSDEQDDIPDIFVPFDPYGSNTTMDFTCSGRDDECMIDEESGKYICDYTLHVEQKFTMTYYPDDYPYNTGFPVKMRESDDGPWTELYYKECLVGLQDGTTEEMAATCRDVVIERDDTNFIAGDGHRRRVSSWNGRIPGPHFCVGYGDLVRVRVLNDVGGFGYEATSIHWHGMFQRDTPWADGVVYVTQCPVTPGQEFQYEFIADPAGTYWFHSHSGVQIADGLFSTLVVLLEDDIEAQLYGDVYDTDEPDQIMFLNDWDHENYQSVMVNHVNHWVDYATGLPIETPKAPQDGQIASGHPYMSGMINGYGTHSVMNNRGEKEYINLQPYIFTVKRMRKIRFRMVCGSAMFAFRVSVDDHMLTVIAMDGFDIQPVEVDAIIIFTAERYDFIVFTNQPEGNYWIRAETLSRDGLVKAVLHYEGADIHPPDSRSQFRQISDRDLEAERNVPKCEREECRVIGCPWPEEYSDNLNIKCVEFKDLRRNRDDDELRNTPQEKPDVERALELGNVVYLNFNLLGDSQRSEFPNINGIKGTLPPTPPVALRDPLNELSWCSPDDEGSFKTCVHRIDLNYNEPHLFVLTNRWPDQQNPEDGRNFPGAQTHPLHMHGHSFYVVAHEQGTINNGMYDAGTFGCQSGIGDCAFDHYCFDEDTINGKLLCDDYWGNCTFVDGYFPELTPIEEAPQKDTIPIPVHGYVILAIQANNPGWWVMHCHLDAHLSNGMMMILNEGFYDVDPRDKVDGIPTFNDLPLPEGFPSCGNNIIPSGSSSLYQEFTNS